MTISLFVYTVWKGIQNSKEMEITLRSRSTGDAGRDPAKKLSSSRSSTNKTH